MRRLHSIEELIASLRARRVREVRLTGKVATTTPAGGKQITFRGRLVLSAQVGAGEQVEYVESVRPYVTETQAPELPLIRRRATDLQRSQFALMRQLQAYRGEYQQVMETARSSLTAKLREAGITVVEPEG
jgi:isoaspartyl peptidase/L-asparaginase-like protein (Ntn-hydrolase superfamily)